MKIAGLQKFSTIDYPGHLSAVVFTNGCNYDCWYCHNRQLIDGRAGNIPADYLLDFFEKRKNLLGGVVISGGEPTVQPDLPEFIKLIKGMDYLVKLDSNGSNPAMLRKCLPLVDYVAIDYKAPGKMYEKVCRHANYAYVLESLRLLGESAVRWEVRTTLIPEAYAAQQIITDELNAMKLSNLPERHRFNKYLPPQVTPG